MHGQQNVKYIKFKHILSASLAIFDAINQSSFTFNLHVGIFRLNIAPNIAKTQTWSSKEG